MAIDSGDTAFMLVSTALVMLMTVGLAFFYGGLVRARHVLGIKMQSFAAFGVVTAVWVIVGYSLAFGPDMRGLLGSLAYAGLQGVGGEPHAVYGPTIPHTVFMAFQLMFAIITPALISGAFADRMRFKSYLVFIAAWLLLVYVPLAHWIWGGGWLAQGGVIDFAGGYVVHMSAGFAALACVFVFRPRKLREGERTDPHNIPYVALGAGLLWFGWFGFNAGSALAANAVAANAFVTTMLGGSFGMLTWMSLNWAFDGKPTATGAMTGAVAGLATITPASGFVAPWAAIVIGILAGAIPYAATKFRARKTWDDALDVWACHGIGGTVGVIATGIFASAAVNNQRGLVEGGAGLFLAQVGAAVFVAIFAFGMTYAILRVLKALGPIQVPEQAEIEGIDAHEHGEVAYQLP
ncbi:MAG TPA: ammonium transporter [Candidatus Thermoplasmatota archaeon]|jgi:Amt family ammonium transporter|nr:ammonium transporter [Candidatus Thermoplasmatota archaeon]